MSKLKSLFLVAITTSLMSCAFGTGMSLKDTDITFKGSSNKVIAVTAFDARPYVLSGDKTPEWIGVQRSGYGIPFGVHTSSKKTLGEEFASSVSSALKSNGINSYVVVGPRLAKSRQEVLRSVSSKGANFDKVLLVEFDQWRSDTMNNVRLDYDVKFAVLDRSMNEIVNRSVSHSESLKGSFWNPIGASERSVVSAQKRVFEELLSSSEISQALQ